MGKIFKVSFVSDMNQILKDEDILAMIYGSPNSKDSSVSGKAQSALSIQQLVDIITKNENIKSLMRCILQSSIGDD
jgi:hypothetical protein